jgi:hypothetical protein
MDLPDRLPHADTHYFGVFLRNLPGERLGYISVSQVADAAPAPTVTPARCRTSRRPANAQRGWPAILITPQVTTVHQDPAQDENNKVCPTGRPTTALRRVRRTRCAATRRCGELEGPVSQPLGTAFICANTARSWAAVRIRIETCETPRPNAPGTWRSGERRRGSSTAPTVDLRCVRKVGIAAGRILYDNTTACAKSRRPAPWIRLGQPGVNTSSATPWCHVGRGLRRIVANCMTPEFLRCTQQVAATARQLHLRRTQAGQIRCCPCRSARIRGCTTRRRTV